MDKDEEVDLDMESSQTSLSKNVHNQDSIIIFIQDISNSSEPLHWNNQGIS